MTIDDQKFSKVSKFFDDEERKKLFKKEFNKYKRICKALPDNKQKIALPLAEELAFVVVALKELKLVINRDGFSEEYINGKNQRGIKRTVAADLQVAYQKNYSMLFKQFKDMLPSDFDGDDMDAWERANS